MVTPRDPQLIEQTAKRFKAVQAVGAIAGLGGGVGILLTANRAPFLAGCFVAIAAIGVIAYFTTRFLAWWHHG